jgi:hypothetical protein
MIGVYRVKMDLLMVHSEDYFLGMYRPKLILLMCAG